MNTNLEVTSTGGRLQRIRTVSRVVRYVMLGFFFFSAGYFLFYGFILGGPRDGGWNAGIIVHAFMMLGLEGMLCFWYWKLAKLFSYYEQGLIFAAETIRCIKTLGLLCVINWLLLSILEAMKSMFPPPAPVLTPGTTVTVIPSHFQPGFFHFSIYGINVGLLLAGVVIVLIAWIMDEGRKIKEEQELTV